MESSIWYIKSSWELTAQLRTVEKKDNDKKPHQYHSQMLH